MAILWTIYISISQDELHKLHHSKHHKTPWGKVKDIIQIRKDSLRKKQYRLSARSDDTRAEWSAGDASDQEDAVFLDVTDTAPTVTITNTEEPEEGDTSTLKNEQRHGSDGDRWHVESEEDKSRVCNITYAWSITALPLSRSKAF